MTYTAPPVITTGGGGPPGGGDPRMTYTAPPVITTGGGGGGWTPGGGITNIFPRTRTTTTGGVTGSINKFMKFLTGKHFGAEGNRQKLVNAYNRGLIDERQYKIMSGYDAEKEMGLTPLGTFLSSGIYNIGKKIMHPEDYEKIGAWESTLLNTLGGKGQGFDKDVYSGITGLSSESLRTDPYGSSLGAQRAQRLDIAPAYDFDYPTNMNRGGIVSVL